MIIIQFKVIAVINDKISLTATSKKKSIVFIYENIDKDKEIPQEASYFINFIAVVNYE